MARLSFCTDEHVPEAFVTALESNGFLVSEATVERGQETDDRLLLEWCRSESHVLVTNDRDFVELDGTVDHSGIVVHPKQTLTPGDFARAIRRVDRQYSPESIADTFLWLGQWV